MKRIIVFMLMAFFIFTLTSCNQDSTDLDYRRGIEGLSVRFLDHSFSSEIYEETDFFLALDVRNNGVTDVKKAKIIVSTERNFIEDFENVVYVDLIGRSKYFNQGEREIKNLELKTKKILVTQKVDTKIRVDVCYPYRTLLSIPICIESDYVHEYKERPNECPAREMSFRGGQGGPVVITSVVPKMIPSPSGITPSFEITVENLGRGLVVNEEVYESACSGRVLGNENYGVVNVKGIYLGNDQLLCTNNILRVETIQRGNEFYDVNRAVIRCVGKEISRREPYISNLRVDLGYGYKDFVEETLRIAKYPN